MIILRTVAVALSAAGLALKTGWATLAGLISDCTQWTPAHK